MMDRLLAQSIEGPDRIGLGVNGVKGEDLCSGCDEEMCNQESSCGYVQVRFGNHHCPMMCQVIQYAMKSIC